jgi:protein-tyrosine-phosphatase
MGRTVLFVCAHGAARSRLAAAWFNTDPPPGWHATTAAGEQPSATLNPLLPRLLAATPAETHLDHSPPRPLAAAGDADMVVAIDCELRGADQWTLTAAETGETMRDELRDRVTALVRTLTSADASPP